jgi:hypothetical protein
MRIVAILSVWRHSTFWLMKPLLAYDTIRAICAQVTIPSNTIVR